MVFFQQVTAHNERLFEAVPLQGQWQWRRWWHTIRGESKASLWSITQWGADLADLQQLRWSWHPVLQGEWVPVALMWQEMPPQSQHGLDGGMQPLPFVDELGLGCGMS